MTTPAKFPLARGEVFMSQIYYSLPPDELVTLYDGSKALGLVRRFRTCCVSASSTLHHCSVSDTTGIRMLHLRQVGAYEVERLRT